MQPMFVYWRPFGRWANANQPNDGLGSGDWKGSGQNASAVATRRREDVLMGVAGWGP